MRGEHVTGYAGKFYAPGSSPHARGALAPFLRAVYVLGIIPACAGSTGHGTRGLTCYWDHPRMRGEHSSSVKYPHCLAGSSPHARGAPAALHAAARQVGIIPACAGSTLFPFLFLFRLRDHPRMRGEHCAVLYSAPVFPGSSPHARGALLPALPLPLLAGIIPASKGSTMTLAYVLDGGRDHPRMRGEHHGGRRVGRVGVGSSPHARGALYAIVKV